MGGVAIILDLFSWLILLWVSFFFVFPLRVMWYVRICIDPGW